MRLVDRVGVIDVVKGGAEFFCAKSGAIFDRGIKLTGSGEAFYFVQHVPVVGVVFETRRRDTESGDAEHPFDKPFRFFDSSCFERVHAMDISSLSLIKKRIICSLTIVMSTVVGGVAGICVAVGCAFLGGFWVPGDSFENIFPSRAGFSAGAVNLQADQGFGWIKAGEGAGAYTYGVGQRPALLGKAVGLPAQSEGCSGGAVGSECGGERLKDARGGVFHVFPPCQHVVDGVSVGAYRSESSGLGLSLSSPFALRLGPRSDSGGIPSRFAAVSFSGSVLASSVR